MLERPLSTSTPTAEALSPVGNRPELLQEIAKTRVYLEHPTYPRELNDKLLKPAPAGPTQEGPRPGTDPITGEPLLRPA
jgi:hypothetical protein